jgi:hypothetical protein
MWQELSGRRKMQRRSCEAGGGRGRGGARRRGGRGRRAWVAAARRRGVAGPQAGRRAGGGPREPAEARCGASVRPGRCALPSPDALSPALPRRAPPLGRTSPLAGSFFRSHQPGTCTGGRRRGEGRGPRALCGWPRRRRRRSRAAAAGAGARARPAHGGRGAPAGRGAGRPAGGASGLKERAAGGAGRRRGDGREAARRWRAGAPRPHLCVALGAERQEAPQREAQVVRDARRLALADPHAAAACGRRARVRVCACACARLVWGPTGRGARAPARCRSHRCSTCHTACT